MGTLEIDCQNSDAPRSDRVGSYEVHMRILVLEDEDSIRRMISALVHARGFDVVGVATGVKALDEASKTVPDVAILDLMVPGAFDGFEVCRRLRANERTANMPIIIISALDDATSRERALEAGATTYFVKPFSAIALLKELEAVKAGRPLPNATLRPKM
ncbi:MAG: response regulator [Polyangiales bacterium]